MTPYPGDADGAGEARRAAVRTRATIGEAGDRAYGTK